MKKRKNRPILLIANSSWYLFHYRNLLIKTLKKTNYVVTLSPYDNFTQFLEENSINFLWYISQNAIEINPFEFSRSLIRMIFFIKVIKPKLLHSHTLKANLATAITAYIFNIPNVLSFTGFGRLSTSPFSCIFLKFILKIILFLSTHKLSRNSLITCSKGRGSFIFQNKHDLDFYYKHIDKKKSYKCNLIYGSGIPEIYLKRDIPSTYGWDTDHEKCSNNIETVNIIFCGRLLISKGIRLFLELAKSNNDYNNYIFGSINSKSKDYIKSKEIEEANNIFNNIQFLGNKENPLLTINFNKPILVVPSLYGEGLSRSIIEAMSLEIPVICSENATSGIFDERMLYIAKRNTIEDYSACIKNIYKDYENKSLQKKLLYSKEKCFKIFTEQEIVKQTINVYKNFLNN